MKLFNLMVFSASFYHLAGLIGGLVIGDLISRWFYILSLVFFFIAVRMTNHMVDYLEKK